MCLCRTDLNKFVDCGSHTEPVVAFVTWPENLLTASSFMLGQTTVKIVRSAIKGRTVCLLVLAVLPWHLPAYLLHALNLFSCAWNAVLVFHKGLITPQQGVGWAGSRVRAGQAGGTCLSLQLSSLQPTLRCPSSGKCVHSASPMGHCCTSQWQVGTNVAPTKINFWWLHKTWMAI